MSNRDPSKRIAFFFMDILYLTQWFDPEPGVIKGPAFVRGLETAGHRVTVVTGIPNYPTGKFYPGYHFGLVQRERLLGCNVVRLPLFPSHSSSSFGRTLNFLSFFLSALAYGLLRGGRYEVVHVYHPPITVGLAASLFGRIWGRPFVLEIQDLWPDMLAASGMAGTSKLAWVIGPICDFVYRRAALIIVQSNGMRTRLMERGVPESKLRVVRNPADPSALLRPEPMAREALGLTADFALVYGGNLGAAQRLGSAVRAARAVAERGVKLQLRLMGHGIEVDDLKALAMNIDAANVSFRPPVAKSELPAVLQAADALLIQWADDPLFNITIPSKTQFYLACGKPILAALSGETADILRESGAAIVVPPGDAEAMAEAMATMAEMPREELDAMGRRGADYYARSFSFDNMVEATLSALERAADRA